MPRRPKGLIVPDGKSATSGNPKRCALQAIIDGVRPLVPSETRLRADVPPIFGNVDRDQHDDGTDAASAAMEGGRHGVGV